MNETSPTTPPTQHKTDRYSLLIEIGVEEIPSNVIAPSLEQLLALSKKHLSAANLSFSDAQVYGTPRRMILFIPELDAMQETVTEVIVGPPERAAVDASGAPTAAAKGFAASQGVALSDIQVSSAESLGSAAKGKKGNYLVVHQLKAGKTTASLLTTMIPEIFAQLSFPRSMRWNETGVAFIRPIRSILALYKNEIIPFSFAGVSSGNRSYGHHITAPDAFEVTDFEMYKDTLAQRFVIIDPEERARKIESQMQDLAKEKNAVLDLTDTALLWDAAHTVEYPKAICGNFETPFLAIPKEIIITAMAEHQGYIPLYKPSGELLPHFITTLNIDAKNLSIIQKGNERVLRARLVDAQFYFDEDRKKKLSELVNPLQRVTFQEKLGTVHEKVSRLTTLAIFIAKAIDCSESEILEIERAAHLCKADLVSGVVREFTSLQGTMGRIYAGLDGEGPAVATAIEEHYLPRFSGGPLPTHLHGQVLAIADKLDTLTGCFGVDLIPTGSEDPYALRRQGLGLIQILLSKPVFRPLSLAAAILEAIHQYESQDKFSGSTLLQPLSRFLKQRMDAHLQSEGIRYDLREAVLFGEIDHPADLFDRACALAEFSKAPLFSPLMTAFKRAIRILPEGFEGKVDSLLLNDPAEKRLYETLVSVQKRVITLWTDQNLVGVLECLATLFEPLNHFFDAVMVMDKNETLRQNRLGLLFEIQQQFEPFGDFSKIVDEE